MLGRYDDVHSAVRANEMLSSRDGIMLRSFVASAVVFSDPPDHTRLRRIVAPQFSKRAAQRWTAEIRELAGEAATGLNSGNIVDLVPALTIPMPINVIAKILGIPREQWPRFRAVPETFAQLFSPQSLSDIVRLLGSAMQAYLRLHSFADAEICCCARQPAEDLLEVLQAGR